MAIPLSTPDRYVRHVSSAFRRTAPARSAQANRIFSDDDRHHTVTLHKGWPGFLSPFLLPSDHERRTFGIDRFSRSGKPPEIYENAGFDPASLRDKTLGALG